MSLPDTPAAPSASPCAATLPQPGSVRRSLRQQRPQSLAGKYRLGERPPARIRVAPHRDHLRDHRYRDLLRRDRSDLQPHWSEHARETLRGDALLFQFLDHVDDLALAADHGDVPRLGRYRPTRSEERRVG